MIKKADYERLRDRALAYYEKAGIPTARYHIVDNFENSRDFANKVGYPVVVKPDNGVGGVCKHRAGMCQRNGAVPRPNLPRA